MAVTTITTLHVNVAEISNVHFIIYMSEVLSHWNISYFSVRYQNCALINDEK